MKNEKMERTQGMKTTTTPDRETSPSLQSLFTAVPMITAGVKLVHSAANGDIVLQRELVPRRQWMAAVARLLRYRRRVHVQLDRNGAAYWRRIDGNSSLEDIAAGIRLDLGIDDETARHGVLAYTRDLMTRGFVGLKVEGRANSGTLTGTSPEV